MKHGLLLINLGTPDSPHLKAVKRYLREFLADKRVITLPAPLRYLLLYGFILPLRARRSAHAYQSIWTPEGSPLLYHSRNLATKLQDLLGEEYNVVLGMRYGNPSLKKAILQLQDCEKITILPLYPQYSSAATGSSIEKALQLLTEQAIIPSMRVIRDFHSHLGFINAQTALIRPHVTTHDHILFSYHGLPENHLRQGKCRQICKAACPASALDEGCYRAQCLQTTSLIAKALSLVPEQYSTAFQSRLGKTPWIKPYTDEVLGDLYSQGIKRIAIACPSFVSDCLETLEEIGIRLKAQWQGMGGEELTLIPCLNDNQLWLNAVVDIIKD